MTAAALVERRRFFAGRGVGGLLMSASRPGTPVAQGETLAFDEALLIGPP